MYRIRLSVSNDVGIICRCLPVLHGSTLTAIAILDILGQAVRTLFLTASVAGVLVVLAAAEFAASRSVQMWHVSD